MEPTVKLHPNHPAERLDAVDAKSTVQLRIQGMTCNFQSTSNLIMAYDRVDHPDFEVAKIQMIKRTQLERRITQPMWMARTVIGYTSITVVRDTQDKAIRHMRLKIRNAVVARMDSQLNNHY